MRNYFFLTALLLGLTACSEKRGAPTEADMGAYLMVYHTDPTHSVHMAVSRDGYTFTAVNEGRPVIAGDTIAMQRGIRDPHIFRGPNGSFYLCMTDLHLFAKRLGYRETQWERDEKYGWGNNRGLVLMKSDDLINWSRTNIIFEDLYPGFENMGCSWAPELTYDHEAGKLMLHYTTRFDGGPNRLYYAYVNDDFTALEGEPKELFQYPDREKNIIDSDIIYAGGKYHLFYTAHEQPGGIKHAVSDRANGGYVYEPEMIDAEPGACEAPTVWKRIGEERWVLMVDVFTVRPHNFGFQETTDFKTYKNLGHFNEGVMKTTNFTSPKHGAVVQITTEEADRLEQHFAAKP
ncbi:MAG: hypothetical protein E7099_01115 [Mediterranea massiliensis]|nr:hypothetical protein [Mediterranea massiliensis]